MPSGMARKCVPNGFLRRRSRNPTNPEGPSFQSTLEPGFILIFHPDCGMISPRLFLLKIWSGRRRPNRLLRMRNENSESGWKKVKRNMFKNILSSEMEDGFQRLSMCLFKIFWLSSANAAAFSSLPSDPLLATQYVQSWLFPQRRSSTIITTT